MNISEIVEKLEKKDWVGFYRKQAGLATDEEFAGMVGVPYDRAGELEQVMLAGANPLLIESVQLYWCTGMRDREKSRALLVQAAEQGDLMAGYILEEREGKW